jgi:hypothetical protein
MVKCETVDDAVVLIIEFDNDAQRDLFRDKLRVCTAADVIVPILQREDYWVFAKRWEADCARQLLATFA